VNARDLVRRHAGFFAILVAVELGLAWCAARLVTTSLRGNVPLHPDGVRAFLRDGGRGSVDLVLGGRPEHIFARPVLAVAVTIALYFFLTRVRKK
jgi:hypothetical protein